MTGSLKVFVEAAAGQFDKAMAGATRDLSIGAMKTANIAADMAKSQGRANIAAAGFSRKWQNTLTTIVYPQKGVSPQPTVLLYHKIAYSDIFEEGGSIAGHPLLWLPLKDAPERIGRQRITPALYARHVGKLFTIRQDGKPPLLAAKIRTGQKGKRGGIQLRTVPMFVGIDSVTLRDRFGIREVAAKVADQMPEIFAGVFNEGG